MHVTDADLDRMFTPRRLPRPQSASVTWSEDGVLEISAGRLAYFATGEGPTVLLVHGWEGTHADLNAFAAPLVARGRRIVTFDHIGHGASSGTKATLFDLRDGVLALADRFGPVDAIVAHSVGSAASAMALVDGMPAQRIAFIATPIKYEDFVRGYAEAARMPAERLLEAVAARDIDLSEMDFLKIAPTLEIPALFVHSADDRVTSAENSERLTRLWRGSRLLRVDGLGHNRILRDDATVTSIVDFVCGSSPAG